MIWWDIIFLLSPDTKFIFSNWERRNGISLENHVCLKRNLLKLLKLFIGYVIVLHSRDPKCTNKIMVYKSFNTLESIVRGITFHDKIVYSLIHGRWVLEWPMFHCATSNSLSTFSAKMTKPCCHRAWLGWKFWRAKNMMIPTWVKCQQFTKNVITMHSAAISCQFSWKDLLT